MDFTNCICSPSYPQNFLLYLWYYWVSRFSIEFLCLIAKVGSSINNVIEFFLNFVTTFFLLPKSFFNMTTQLNDFTKFYLGEESPLMTSDLFRPLYLPCTTIFNLYCLLLGGHFCTPYPALILDVINGCSRVKNALVLMQTL